MQGDLERRCQLKRNARWIEQLGQVEHARELVDKREFAEAKELLSGLRKAATRPSPHVSYWLAITSDYLEEFEMAMSYIEEAISGDPLAVPFHRSFDVICERIRSALTTKGRADDDPSTPRLYKILIDSCEAKLGSHLAMARFLSATKDFKAALKLLEAATTLEPGSREAWVALAAVARAAGEADLAAKADIEAAGLDGAQIPFAVPGRAQS